jgi:hypothetical protein
MHAGNICDIDNIIILTYIGLCAKERNEYCEEITNILFFSNYCNSTLCPNITTIIDSYCNTTTVSPTASVSPSKAYTSTIQRNKIVTVSPTTCVHPPTSTPTWLNTTTTNSEGQSSCTCKTTVNDLLKAVDIAIRGLLGLSLVLLVVVTIGWVCTCIITKKRKRY